MPYVLYIIGRVKTATGLCTKWSMRVLLFIYSREPGISQPVSLAPGLVFEGLRSLPETDHRAEQGGQANQPEAHQVVETGFIRAEHRSH